MGRMYQTAVSIATSAADIDLWELLAASGKPLVLHGFELSQSTEVGDAQEEMRIITLSRVTGAPTSGSGGGTATFQPLTPNDTAAGATLETGNTTVISGGTSVELMRFGWNVRSPYTYLPTPEGRVVLDASTRLVLAMTAAPADTMDYCGWVLIEELV